MRITDEHLKKYENWMFENEKSRATIRQYLSHLRRLREFLDGRDAGKAELLRWKETLRGQLAPATVNTALAAVNSFLRFAGHPEWTVRYVKTGRPLFCAAGKELGREEYFRLVRTARQDGDGRLALLLQTVCATGIRISELPFITAEAVREGCARVECKGKSRTVLLTRKLCALLLKYANERGIRSGAVFVTRTGRPLDRSNIWRALRRLAERAGVACEKVFPHNLRHLFARVYYAQEKDLGRLADILGHSSVNTTRIYTRESGENHRMQLERMQLLADGYNRISLLL